MTTADALEFSISQYADGTLPVDERAALEAVLAVDPAARATLADYRRLDALLATQPVELDWDRLATHLAAAVAEPVDVAGRIGPAWWRAGAIAAAGAVAVSVGLLARHGRPGASPSTPAVAESVAVVSGPTVEAGTGPGEAAVTIGPSPALAARGGSWRYAEGVVGRTPTVVIAGTQSVRGDVRFR